MGVLVNPLGWRLNSNRIWKTNFIISDDQRYGLLTNNLMVGREAVNGLLYKLNKKFFLYGLLKFTNSSLFIENGKLILFIYFRLNLSAFMRFRLKRRYKYYIKERPREEARVRYLSGWIKLALWRIVVYKARIKRTKRQLKFLHENKKYITSRPDKKKLKSIIETKARLLRRTIRALDNLKRKLFKPSYQITHKWWWTRNLRVWRFVRHSDSGVAYRKFGHPFSVRRKQFRKLYRYQRRRRIRVRFTNKVLDLRFNRFNRLERFIPHYSRGFYLHHKRTIIRLFWLKKRKRFTIKSLSGLKAAKKLYSKWKRRFRVLKKYQRPRNIWKGMRRKQKRRAYMLLQEKRRRGDRSPLWELASWRKTPGIRDRLIFAPFYRCFLFYFRFLPLINVLKIHCEKILTLVNPNMAYARVFMLNSSKFNSISAVLLLDYIENFLRRRRRVTKINKLFYRIIKILRFFRAKYRLRGFKFLLAGRFLRRDRATFIWRTRGAVPLGTKLAKIDFGVRSMQMKYSRPIAKIWLCRR